MWSIHTTPGLIIGSRPDGEAGKLLYIFTRDLGLVRARAQGIRLERSKLRYHSQDLSFGIFSLVRGKEYWRLTDAKKGSERIGQVGGAETVNQEMADLLARICLLLRRLLQGEEPHPELYDVIEACAAYLASTGKKIDVVKGIEGSKGADLKALESLTVIRILYALGYVAVLPELSELVSSKEVSDEILDKAAPLRKELNMHINKALRESHL